MNDDLDWRQRGACRDKEADLFFPVGTSGPALKQLAAAKAVCQRCPVRQECLDYAMASGAQYGVFGGLSADERRKLRSGMPPRRHPLAVPTPRLQPAGPPRLQPQSAPPQQPHLHQPQEAAFPRLNNPASAGPPVPAPCPGPPTPTDVYRSPTEWTNDRAT